MKKEILLLPFLLSSCAYEQNIYSYKNIDIHNKTVAISATNLSKMHQELKQALIKSGYKLYVKNENKDIGYNSKTSRYELSDNIKDDPAVTCSLTEAGYRYAISFVDLKTSEEVFSMQGRGCANEILENFTALIKNNYHAAIYEETSQTEQAACVPKYSIGNMTLWCE